MPSIEERQDYFVHASLELHGPTGAAEPPDGLALLLSAWSSPTQAPFAADIAELGPATFPIPLQSSMVGRILSDYMANCMRSSDLATGQTTSETVWGGYTGIGPAGARARFAKQEMVDRGEPFPDVDAGRQRCTRSIAPTSQLVGADPARVRKVKGAWPAGMHENGWAVARAAGQLP